MKQQYQRIEKLIRRLAAVWQERMGLGHYEIEHVFLDSFEGGVGIDDFAVTAVAEVRWQYQQAKIKWYLPSAVRHTDADLEGTLVHELCHVLLGPEQNLVDVSLEQAARQLNNVDDLDPLVEQFYQRLELSTEMASRAIMAGWQQAA
jgi:hypothetical protein